MSIYVQAFCITLLFMLIGTLIGADVVGLQAPILYYVILITFKNEKS